MPPSNKSKSSQATNRSWRQIRQAAPNNSVTVAAQKRKRIQLIKASATLVGLVALIGGITWGVTAWKSSGAMLELSDHNDPIRRILFETDGTLNETWLAQKLSIPRGTSLTEVDIFQLKQGLETHGQVFAAHVERHFPDTLFIELEERMPSARLAVQGEFGVLETLFVAVDGTVYPSQHYDSGFVKTLPYLDGVKLAKLDSGAYKPIRGMDEVNALFGMARRDYPDLAESWRIVSLKMVTPEASPFPASLIVRPRKGPELVFSTTDYRQQLEKLDVILRDLQRRRGNAGLQDIESIDLSLRGPAVVSFGKVARR